MKKKDQKNHKKRKQRKTRRKKPELCRRVRYEIKTKKKRSCMKHWQAAHNSVHMVLSDGIAGGMICFFFALSHSDCLRL